MVTGCQALCMRALVVILHLMEFICIQRILILKNSIYVKILEIDFYKYKPKFWCPVF